MVISRSPSEPYTFSAWRYLVAAVIFVTYFVQATILVGIVPEFESLYADFGVKLPLLTQSIVNLSHFFRSFWFLAWPALAGVTAFHLWLCVRNRLLLVALALVAIGWVLVLGSTVVLYYPVLQLNAVTGH